jgi:hypothetical protein
MFQDNATCRESKIRQWGRANEHHKNKSQAPNHKQTTNYKSKDDKRQDFAQFGLWFDCPFRLLFVICLEFVAWCLEFRGAGLNYDWNASLH